jgi:hypothetical protein
MSVDAVTSQAAETYSAYKTADAAAKKETDSAQTAQQTAQDAGVVYEKSEQTDTKATYSVNKMSESDRAALVKQLQADQESRKQSLISLVQTMMGKQATTFGIATDDDSVWKFLADGDFTVDEAAKAQAQADIAEDGYWGVTQTSQRLFDFASALAGDDEDKMQDMQAAIKKGYEQATAAWGKNLPDICQQTLDATDKLFEDYYASKDSEES